MRLHHLSIITCVLFVLSLFVYNQQNMRGTDLLSGSDFIKGLDFNKVQKIVLKFEKDRQITLVRDLNRFVLENFKSYPADTSKVNDLIYKIASITVKEKSASGVKEAELDKYELNEKKRRYLVEIYDNNGKKTVSFRVGKNFKGNGNYLIKEGKGDVYLSEANVWINSSYKDFVDTLVLDFKDKNIKKISSNGLEINKDGDSFTFLGEDIEKLKPENAKEFVNELGPIRFEEFYPQTDSKVQLLKFNKNIKIQLKSKLVYNIDLAKNKDEHFLKVNALINEVPNQVVIGQNDSKEQLESIEDMVKAQGKAQSINLDKGVWIYKIRKEDFEKLDKDLAFFSR